MRVGDYLVNDNCDALVKLLEIDHDNGRIQIMTDRGTYSMYPSIYTLDSLAWTNIPDNGWYVANPLRILQEYLKYYDVYIITANCLRIPAKDLDLELYDKNLCHKMYSDLDIMVIEQQEEELWNRKMDARLLLFHKEIELELGKQINIQRRGADD